MARKQDGAGKGPPKLKVVPIAAKKPAVERHDPTDTSRTLVSVCAACGYTLEQTAALLKISIPTLRKHYEHELTTGRDAMIAKVAGNLFMTALQRQDLKASNTASIFLLKTRAGWRDVNPDESSDTSGGVEVVLKIGEKEPKVA